MTGEFVPETDGVALSRRDGILKVKVERGDGAPRPVEVVLEAARRRSERVHREAHPRAAVHLGDPEVPRNRQRPVLAYDVQFDQLSRLGYVEVQVLLGI